MSKKWVLKVEKMCEKYFDECIEKYGLKKSLEMALMPDHALKDKIIECLKETLDEYEDKIEQMENMRGIGKTKVEV